MSVKSRTRRPARSSTVVTRWMRPFMASVSFTLFALMILTAYLSPLAYMLVTSLKSKDMISKADAPLWPAQPAVFTFDGKDYDVYSVPAEDGRVHKWALIKKGREESLFLDPQNPDAGPIQWTGKWRTLEQVWHFSLRWDNFSRAWSELRMPLLLRNTLVIAVAGSIGTILSCVAVAYGFSRFRFPAKNVFFTILVATIILPRFVTLVPTYTLFHRIGWVGTWLPLIVPHFLANAYNVFLLRQFFMTIPRDLDEAAMIDGASPLRTLISIILPQSIPVVIAVGLGHFIWAWNDYFEPLIYLAAERDLQPIAIAIQSYNSLFSTEPHLIQASSLLGLLLPVLLFFLFQRFFLQGLAFTGVEK